MSEHPPSTSLPRYAAIAVLFLTLGTCTLQVLAAVDQLGKPDAPGPIFAAFIPPLLTLLIGIGLAGLIDALARIVERELHASGAQQAEIMAVAFKQLSQSLIELRTVLQASAARQMTSAITPAPNLGGDRHLQRMVQLLEELNRRSATLAAAPEAAVTPAFETTPVTIPPAVAASAVAPAVPASEAPAVAPPIEEPQRPVTSDTSEEASAKPEPSVPFAQEPEVAEPAAEQVPIEHPPHAVMDEPVHEEPPPAEPIDVEAVEFEQIHRHVEERLTASNFDGAIAIANQFTQNHPHHAAGNELVKRIVHEANTFIDRTTIKLFDEIRSNVERRQWRRALDLSQHLLERFPEHPRAAKIRQQLRPIQHNAEIEERSVQELRIQELIKSRHYAEAIDLSEDLLRRFPQSTQAATLSELLPKLRERAAAQESAGSGVFAS